MAGTFPLPPPLNEAFHLPPMRNNSHVPAGQEVFCRGQLPWVAEKAEDRPS